MLRPHSSSVSVRTILLTVPSADRAHQIDVITVITPCRIALPILNYTHVALTGFCPGINRAAIILVNCINDPLAVMLILWGEISI